MDIIKERNGIAIVQIGDAYYVVGIDRNAGQVTSVLSADMPRDGGRWYGGISETGVYYVGHGTTRTTAMRNFRRLVNERAYKSTALRDGMTYC